MTREQYERAESFLRSHPGWSDELVAESAGVDPEDVAAVRQVIDSGSWEREPTS